MTLGETVAQHDEKISKNDADHLALAKLVADLTARVEKLETEVKVPDNPVQPPA